MNKWVIAALVMSAALGIYIWVTSLSRVSIKKQAILQSEGGPLIQHLACVMDGNRRWAKEHGMVPWYGHREGVEAVKRVVQFCLEKKIPYLSLYTFSLENFKRSSEENSYLFSLMVQEADTSLSDFKKYGLRMRFIGDRSQFPKQLLDVLDRVEKETAGNSAMTVNFLFCYGGQQEIVAATQAIAREVKEGKLAIDQITPEVVSKHLWLHDMPDPEIIIRTGGYKRLSNFLLFQAAYSELYFLDCLWPQITDKDLEDVLASFMQTKRNFGT